jgi:DNA-binding NtrC family response regulator
MKKFGKILVIDDHEETLQELKNLLADHFVKVDGDRNPNIIPSYISRNRYDAYILKMNYKSGIHNGNEGIYWMNRIFEQQVGARVILTASTADVRTAVRAIKEGASDFLMRPLDSELVLDSVMQACKPGRHSSRLLEKKAIDRRKPGAIQIVGSSEPMKRLLNQVIKVAGTDANVLITGENGTGKELVARAIHQHSGRAGEAFISVDMGSLTGSLFESELFGHKKGAFTDANEDRPGRFETANHGTLFMDEIGNLPLSLQPKLLAVLQNRMVVRIGTNTPVPVDIRLVTATNMPLDRMVRDGRFREDLLYRLNTITIEVPSLRERKADIKPLFYHFKEKYESRYNRHGLVVGDGVFELLQSWHWPGNVRELEHAVEKAVIMCDSEIIRPDDFSFCKNGDTVLPGDQDCYNLAKNEMKIINKAIEQCRGNLSQASRILGITRKTLYNKISKYGI